MWCCWLQGLWHLWGSGNPLDPNVVHCEDSFYTRLLCRIVFVLPAGDFIPKVIQINEYNMFGEYITVTKIPSWVSKQQDG